MRVKGFGLADGFMMTGVAFLLERSGVVVDSQTVADEDAAEVFSEDLLQQLTCAALNDDIEGQQLGSKNPQPPARTGDPPAGLITMKRRCLAQFCDQASYWGLTLTASRSRAWERPPGLSCRPKQSRKTPQVLRMESPLALLRSAARARARGPRCTPAAPLATDICKGCLDRTL